MKLKIDIRRDLAVAVTDAQYDYMEMTGKREFRAVEKSIPEKILEVAAARRCWNNLRGHGYHVIQEYTFSNINRNIKEYFGDSRAKKYMGNTKRVDIAILDNSQKIYALVEVKRKGSLRDTYSAGDVSRLRELRKYIEDRTGQWIAAYFIYASTLHYANEEMYIENIETEKDNSEDKFCGKPFIYFDKNKSYKLAENDLNFCFGAICGVV